MPNPKLPDTFKGQTFGEISKNIESKYKDRFDPISRRGLMAEMGALRDEQEFQKAKQQAREQLQQLLTQQQQPQDPMQMQQGQDPMMQQPMQTPEVFASNQGVAPEIPQEDMGNFAHAASQSYNQKFAHGGNMDYGYGGQMKYFNGGPFDTITITPTSGMESQMQPQTSPQTNNPLRYAPIAANLLGILNTRRAPSTQSQMRGMGFNTRVDETLANRVTPRQTQFGNVDMSQIERGIQDQARGFTGANVNVSGGQSGQFMANELANQSNVMNAIGQARMQGQMQDRQTQAMNAQEQARVESMLQQQAMQRAGIQGQNIGIGMQMADLDARNEGAFNSMRMSGIQALGQNIGNIGRESDQMTMIANALGYNSFGEYVQSLPAEQRPGAAQALMQSLGNIFKARR